VSNSPVAESILVTEGDDELVAIAEELHAPVVVATARFGDLTLDRRLEIFVAAAQWNGKPISLCFHTGEVAELNEYIKTAEELWDYQAEWKRRVDDFAAQQLLPVKNDYWLQDGERPFTEAQFKARMTLQQISIQSEGGFEFWHHDGDLFWGHAIQIAGSLKDGLMDADIPG
jgi:hypothetical protein